MITILDSMSLELLDIPAREVYVRNKSKSERQYIRILENSIQIYSTIERDNVTVYGKAIIIHAK